ncbi:uncharacterized protein F5147DRAFT_775129 [Suillus discolor]|uniref:DUF6532 domain-containing protein n=1 Tax=Suillus discolor TaxID=1912936 RepID=A0A9P7F3N5_9AGAM|nr:uncharacterized protein F5147DRAFT_775129 [Suillus discolor]KAG2105809.1 hypothetical protein F5147DRAFT_775129 [Suillus discolor]
MAKIEPSATPVCSIFAKLKRRQNVPDTMLEHMKARDAYRTVDLPAAVRADQCWTKKYLPTILLWAGSYKDIWVIPDDVLLHHAQLIFDAVYKDLNFVLVHNGVVHSLTAQRISEWHNNFGSTAIAIIMDFMTRNSDCAPSDLATSLVHDWIFVYEDPDSPSPLTAYRSPFISQLLGRAHFNVIKGYVKVPAFDMHELVTSGMPRLLALSTVVIEHALVLFKNKQLKVQDVLLSASRSKVAIKLPKVLNKLTEKETNDPFSFSVTLWSKPTKGFIKLILNKPAGYVEATIEMACKVNGATDTPSSDDEEWYNDERAMIGEHGLNPLGLLSLTTGPLLQDIIIVAIDIQFASGPEPWFEPDFWSGSPRFGPWFLRQLEPDRKTVLGSSSSQMVQFWFGLPEPFRTLIDFDFDNICLDIRLSSSGFTLLINQATFSLFEGGSVH